MFEISDAKINKKKYSTKDTIDKALQTKLLQKSSFSCFLIENTDNSLSRIIKNRLYAFFYISKLVKKLIILSKEYKKEHILIANIDNL